MNIKRGLTMKKNRDKEYTEFITTAKTITIETAFNEGYNRGFHNAEKLYNKTGNNKKSD
jgi:hypothetical protein